MLTNAMKEVLAVQFKIKFQKEGLKEVSSLFCFMNFKTLHS